MTAGIAAGLFSAPFPEGTDMFTGFGAEDMVVLLAASAILLTFRLWRREAGSL